jgi:hypothetical protein
MPGRMTAKSELCPAVSFRHIVSKTPLQFLATGHANYQKVNRVSFFHPSGGRQPLAFLKFLPLLQNGQKQNHDLAKTSIVFLCLVLPEAFSFYAVPRHERIYEMINGDYF